MKEWGLVQIDEKWEKIHISDYDRTIHGQVFDPLERRLVPKQGQSKKWHYALGSTEVKYSCDEWKYKKNKGEWHLLWQSYSPLSHVEVYWKGENDCHIADLIDKNGRVVEFQHSPIKFEEVKSREECYSDMYWVIDATGSKYLTLPNKRVLILEYAPWWNYISKPRFFDMGYGIACLNTVLYQSFQDLTGYKCLRYYLCTVCSYQQFINDLFVVRKGVQLSQSHQKTYTLQPHYEILDEDSNYMVFRVKEFKYSGEKEYTSFRQRLNDLKSQDFSYELKLDSLERKFKFNRHDLLNLYPDKKTADENAREKDKERDIPQVDLSQLRELIAECQQLIGKFH